MSAIDKVNFHQELDASRVLKLARQALEIEINALQLLRERIGHELVQAMQLILNSHGRVAVMGMGKSGLIGRKIAATLSSTD